MKLFRPKDHYDRGEILRKAETYRSRGRVRKAIREYERVLAVDPQDIEVHTKLGPLYLRAGRKDQAKASLKRVINWYDRQGFVEKTIAMLRLALTLDRRDLASHLRLADLYLGKTLEGDALRHLEGARRAFRRRRFLREAIAVEEKILSFAPDNFRAQVSLVRRLWKAGRRREAGQRLWEMESQWALKRHKRHWRRARWLLFRHAPCLASYWGYLVSLCISPVAYSAEQRHRLAA
jgi:tetratricopeptide (TPR) repeat protein